MNFKQYVKDHEGTFKHRYIWDGAEKVGVVVVTNTGQVGWSMCSERDTFCKAKGKAIALLRAESGKVGLIRLPYDKADFAEQVQEKIGYLLSIEENATA